MYYDFTRDLSEREVLLGSGRKNKINEEIFKTFGVRIRHWNDNITKSKAFVLKIIDKEETIQLKKCLDVMKNNKDVEFDFINGELWVSVDIVRDNGRIFGIIIVILVLLLLGSGIVIANSVL